MAKLYFRYGCVGSAKTLNLLAVAHNYERQGKRVAVLKPAIDDRFGREHVGSRAGIKREADALLEPDSRLDTDELARVHCILVDEAQFLSGAVVEQLRHVASFFDVPAICYGLRTDFRGQLFEGSRRLLELADSIEEVKTTCSQCERKAILNLKRTGTGATVEGDGPELGFEELYVPVCYEHFRQMIVGSKDDPERWPWSYGGGVPFPEA
ncbi:MAG: thymidine kinase [Planctomycetota bacterium]